LLQFLDLRGPWGEYELSKHVQNELTREWLEKGRRGVTDRD
jgi:hypothetical protein